MWRTPYDGELRRGMTVMIRPDLAECDQFEWPNIAKAMIGLAGQCTTIESCFPEFVHLEGASFNYLWIPKWLLIDEPDELDITVDFEEVL